MADEAGDIGGGALSGAATGATFGSAIPGIGTAIGAVGGGLIGGFEGLFKYKKQKKAEDAEKELEAQQKAQATPAQSNDTLINTLSLLSKNNLSQQKEQSFSGFKSLNDMVKEKVPIYNNQSSGNGNETLISYLKLLGGGQQSSSNLGTPIQDYS